jgi:phosphoribosylformylglycinamidine synthase
MADAGAEPEIFVINNLTSKGIAQSVETFASKLKESQIVFIPGGFSGGDEPDGSGKFITAFFRNPEIKNEVHELLKNRDGLMCGICNGFQALIKLGLVPNGTISEQKPDSPTLTYNNIGRHISKMVNLKVVSNKSPWLAGAELGGVYVNPVSHGEGRFVASEEWLKKLFANGQVATQYVDANGNATMDEYWNPNGSYMAIEGITSPDGRIYGKMAHSERRGDAVAKNIYGEQDLKLFESGVKYFR